MVVGIAKTCGSMTELRDRMAALRGEVPVQMRFYLPPVRRLTGGASRAKSGYPDRFSE